MNAPVELAQLGLDPNAFVRSDSKSWRGSCPRCGGRRRLLVFTDHPFPKWRATCDGCGLKAWADQLNAALKQPVDDATRREWAERNEREARERDERRRKRLAEFSTSEIWNEFHRRMQEANRAWWRSQGIPDSAQDFYRLGFVPDKNFMDASTSEWFRRDAYTVPIFETGWSPVNVQYRIVDPPPSVGKYRQEHGIPAAAFRSWPDLPVEESAEVFVVEGAKKAIVLCVHTDAQVIGLPGALSWAGMDARLQNAERVWVMLDPDTWSKPTAAGTDWQPPAVKLAKAIGPQARAVELPHKPDDMLTRYGGDANTIRQLCKYGRAG